MEKVIAILFLLVTLSSIAQKRSKSGKWIKLFNGKNLKGWTVRIKDHPVNDNFGNTFLVENELMKVGYDQYYGKFKGQFGHISYKKQFSATFLLWNNVLPAI